MYSYIGIDKQNIYIINKSTLHVINIYTKQKSTIQHSCELVYVKKNIVIDINKRMYAINTALTYIATLHKNISSMQVCDNIYFTDRFGDTYKIQESQLHLLFGSMSFTTSFVIGDFFYTGDKYGRVKKCTEQGKIIEYMFFAGPILDLKIHNKKLIILIKNELLVIEQGLQQSISIQNGLKLLVNDNKLYLLCKEGILLYDIEKNVTEVYSDQRYLDFDIINSSICGITADGTLSYGGEILYEFDTIYKTNHELIEHIDKNTTAI